MSNPTISWLQILTSVCVFSTVAVWYVGPSLTEHPVNSALIAQLVGAGRKIQRPAGRKMQDCTVDLCITLEFETSVLGTDAQGVLGKERELSDRSFPELRPERATC